MQDCQEGNRRVETAQVDAILQRTCQLNYVRLSPAAMVGTLHAITLALQQLSGQAPPHHGPIYEIIEKITKELESSIPPASIAHIMWIWASLRQRPGLMACRRVCHAASTAFAGMSAEQLSTCAWCMGTQDMRAKSRESAKGM